MPMTNASRIRCSAPATCCPLNRLWVSTTAAVVPNILTITGTRQMPRFSPGCSNLVTIPGYLQDDRGSDGARALNVHHRRVDPEDAVAVGRLRVFISVRKPAPRIPPGPV